MNYFNQLCTYTGVDNADVAVLRFSYLPTVLIWKKDGWYFFLCFGERHAAVYLEFGN